MALNMPQVGQDIPEARIVEWVKREAEVVKAGDVVAVVESDKATFEVQAENPGVLLQCLRADVDPATIPETLFDPLLQPPLAALCQVPCNPAWAQVTKQTS